MTESPMMPGGDILQLADETASKGVSRAKGAGSLVGKRTQGLLAAGPSRVDAQPRGKGSLGKEEGAHVLKGDPGRMRHVGRERWEVGRQWGHEGDDLGLGEGGCGAKVTAKSSDRRR